MGHTLTYQKLLLIGNHNVLFAECASAMRLVKEAAFFFVRGNETHYVALYIYQTFAYNICFL